MKRVLIGVTALVGLGLVAAAGTVLVQETHPSAGLDAGRGPLAVPADVRPVADVGEGDGVVRVVDPSLVVNKDGSTAVGAFAENGTHSDVALMSVFVWVDGRPVRVNATEMWLPVLADDRSQVGAASDAGGFVIPAGIVAGTRAEVAFVFDDGRCVLEEVTAVARTNKHRMIYPTSNRSIGPVTDDDPPTRSAACGVD